MNRRFSFSGKKYHPFHLVTPSPWPFFVSLGAFILVIGLVAYMHRYVGGGLLIIYALQVVGACLILWWRDVIREATFERRHTIAVQRGLRLGFILFIVSEVIFFFAFFWAFFHSSLSPTVAIGCNWPPMGIEPFDPWGIPFVNTCILLLSGATITAVHYKMVHGDRYWTRRFFLHTIFLAFLFTAVQLSEYLESGFSINDGIYGSTFFLATGFHGFHVLIGTTFIIICFFRFLSFHFHKTAHHHIGFESAAWYWHFVDVVWLFLFISIYWWGGY